MKKKTNLQFAKALYEVTKDVPDADVPAVIKQFFIVLQRNNKLKKINYIVEEFISYSKKQSGIKTIEIETKEKLTAQALEKIKKIFGEKSDIKETLNKNMIGGIKIRIDDMVYDASLKTQLNKLKQSLQV
jgi:F-type H+-transporting ATPase subunit delta